MLRVMAKTLRVGDTIRVNDRMQKRYSYVIEARPGRDFAAGFTPFYTPKEMLALGVFEEKYCNDCRRELPDPWFKGAKAAAVADVSLNCFGALSRATPRKFARIATRAISSAARASGKPCCNGLTTLSSDRHRITGGLP
jgi:hypothetical protein